MNARCRLRPSLRRGGHAHAGGAVQARIDVPGAGNLKAGKAIKPSQRGHNLLRDDLGRLAQLARQLKRDGRGQLAKLQLRRNLQRNGLKLKIVLGLENRAKMLSKPFLQFQIHVGGPQKSLIFKVILTGLLLGRVCAWQRELVELRGFPV